MGMTLEVTRGAVATLLEEAAAAHPHECCGLLLGQGDRIVRTQPCVNVHPDPARHFEIDPRALIAAHKAERAGGERLAGYYHSHPAGKPQPSANDQREASGDGRVWAIVAGTTIGWWLDAPGGFQVLPTRLVEG